VGIRVISHRLGQSPFSWNINKQNSILTPQPFLQKAMRRGQLFFICSGTSSARMLCPFAAVRSFLEEEDKLFRETERLPGLCREGDSDRVDGEIERLPDLPASNNLADLLDLLDGLRLSESTRPTRMFDMFMHGAIFSPSHIRGHPTMRLGHSSAKCMSISSAQR
jgi:hypothetical protein